MQTQFFFIFKQVGSSSRFERFFIFSVRGRHWGIRQFREQQPDFSFAFQSGLPVFFVFDVCFL